jgi:hypothetical protein
MRAMQIEWYKPLEARDHPDPEPWEGSSVGTLDYLREVLVRVLAGKVPPIPIEARPAEEASVAVSLVSGPWRKRAAMTELRRDRSFPCDQDRWGGDPLQTFITSPADGRVGGKADIRSGLRHGIYRSEAVESLTMTPVPNRPP